MCSPGLGSTFDLESRLCPKPRPRPRPNLHRRVLPKHLRKVLRKHLRRLLPKPPLRCHPKPRLRSLHQLRPRPHPNLCLRRRLTLHRLSHQLLPQSLHRLLRPLLHRSLRQGNRPTPQSSRQSSLRSSLRSSLPQRHFRPPDLPLRLFRRPLPALVLPVLAKSAAIILVDRRSARHQSNREKSSKTRTKLNTVFLSVSTRPSTLSGTQPPITTTKTSRIRRLMDLPSVTGWHSTPLILSAVPSVRVVLQAVPLSQLSPDRA